MNDLFENDYLKRFGGSIKSAHGGSNENYDIGTPENTMQNWMQLPQSQDDCQRQVDTMQRKMHL